MAYLDIHKALTKSVIDLSLGLPIAHEDSDFDPEGFSGNQFLQLDILYDEQTTVTKTNLDDVDGFMQITNRTKSGLGVGLTYALVDALNTAYPHAKKFTSGTQVVNIQNIDVNKRGNINGWYTTDITINFWTDLTRA